MKSPFIEWGESDLVYPNFENNLFKAFKCGSRHQRIKLIHAFPKLFYNSDLTFKPKYPVGRKSVKLSENTVKEIRGNDSLSIRKLAAKYGVNHTTIFNIKHGKLYK